MINVNKKGLLWLRSEQKPFEKRSPLSPQGVKRLINNDINVIVEKSSKRIFKDSDYQDVGALLVEEHSWRNAPREAIILGLKELNSDDTFELTHKHIHFGHAFKKQSGHQKYLDRFVRGKGMLYDLEFLLNKDNRRIAAFGYFAGYAGAVLSLKIFIHKIKNPKIDFPRVKTFSPKNQLVKELKSELDELGVLPKVMITGHLGRCGSGAKEFFNELYLPLTLWDRNETSDSKKTTEEIFKNEIFLNCVLLNEETPIFLNRNDLKLNKKLRVICDISCDPTSPYNPLPIYSSITTMDKPVIEIDELISLCAIDHLPGLMPLESSIEYEADFLPYLEGFILNDSKYLETWNKAHEVYLQVINQLT